MRGEYWQGAGNGINGRKWCLMKAGVLVIIFASSFSHVLFLSCVTNHAHVTPCGWRGGGACVEPCPEHPGLGSWVDEVTRPQDTTDDSFTFSHLSLRRMHEVLMCADSLYQVLTVE